MTYGENLSEHDTAYDVRTVRMSEDGPGAYTFMFVRFCGEDNDALSRCGYRGNHTMAVRVSSGKKSAYHDPTKLLMKESFTAPDSVIDDFIKSIMWDENVFEALVDGEVYDSDDMEEIIDGAGR